MVSESDLIFSMLVIIFLMQLWNGAPKRELPAPVVEPPAYRVGHYVHPAQRI